MYNPVEVERHNEAQRAIARNRLAKLQDKRRERALAKR